MAARSGSKSYDDGYEPDRAIENTRRLIEHDQVFALIGEVGTPTSKAAQPIATQAGVPFIGPFTGAGFLRDPKHGNIVNYRATFAQETEAWIKHLNGRPRPQPHRHCLPRRLLRPRRPGGCSKSP